MDVLAQFFRLQECEVAPGVFAVILEDYDGSMIVNWIRAKREGAGVVGKWLDALPTDQRVCFIAITSDRLDGMLARRGFKRCLVPMPMMDDFTPCRVRRAA